MRARSLHGWAWLAALTRDAVQHRRGRSGIAPHADREPQEKPRLDVVMATRDELPA